MIRRLVLIALTGLMLPAVGWSDDLKTRQQEFERYKELRKQLYGAQAPDTTVPPVSEEELLRMRDEAARGVEALPDCPSQEEELAAIRERERQRKRPLTLEEMAKANPMNRDPEFRKDHPLVVCADKEIKEHWRQLKGKPLPPHQPGNKDLEDAIRNREKDAEKAREVDKK